MHETFSASHAHSCFGIGTYNPVPLIVSPNLTISDFDGSSNMWFEIVK
jgi:hypothetical protein